MINALGRSWLSSEGMAALLVAAVLTTAAATVQVFRGVRLQHASLSREDRRRLLAQIMAAIGTALIFWLLLIGACLLRALESRIDAPWW